jgi:hypothetical protein
MDTQTLRRINADITIARQDLAAAMKAAEAATIEASDLGVTQVSIAMNLGVDRMTIRKWLSKAKAQDAE